MKSKFLIILLSAFLLPFFLIGQSKKKKQSIFIGLQSGVHNSFYFIEESPVDKESFLGLSFGLVAQKKLGSVKFRWASFSSKVGIHLETGLLAVRDGYQYEFSGQDIFHEEYSLKIPIAFLLKADDKRQYKALRKRNLKVVARYGVSLSLRRKKEISKTSIDTDGNTLVERSLQTAKIRVPFYAGLGLEKRHSDGGRSSCNVSISMSGKPSVSGEILVTKDGRQDRGFLSKHIWYYSIDLQYFLAPNKRFGKAIKPPIIFNPRH